MAIPTVKELIMNGSHLLFLFLIVYLLYKILSHETEASKADKRMKESLKRDKLYEELKDHQDN